MDFGFTTTSFRQIKDLEKIVNIARQAEADCIEWGGDKHVKSIEDALRAKQLCDKAGIRINSYASYYRVGCKNSDEWKKICEIASAMGARSVRVWLGKADSEKTDEATYKQIVEDTKNICNTAKEYGLTVCPECHDNTFNNNTDAFLKIYNEVGCDNFRTYFQSRYKRLQYDLDRIERTLPYIETVHISFSEQSREQFPMFNPTYIDKLIDKIVSSGFDGNILLEYTYLCGYYGIPSCMIKDMKRLKDKVGGTR
ncbi:MAG: sugar phosphate isomerase/epimerase [Clostridia bacterium]|nr:sugar phosphate isomerase/epimerase [Clostridia bacterium]